jgi:hypothetical protein
MLKQKLKPERVPERVLFDFTQIKNPATLCIYWVFFFTAGGDEKIRTSDPGFAQMLP